MVEKLLKVRSDVKKRKPTYTRQQVNQYAKFKNFDGWRRPKGYQSKMRLGRRGHKAMPEVGYGSPKAVRGLNKDGLLEVVVHNVSDLVKVEKGNLAVIGSKVGGRKRLDILAKAKELKLSVGNVKDIDAKIKELTKTPKKTEKKSEAKKEAPAKKAEKVEDKK